MLTVRFGRSAVCWRGGCVGAYLLSGDDGDSRYTFFLIFSAWANIYKYSPYRPAESVSNGSSEIPA